jgi:hypothetical protein
MAKAIPEITLLKEPSTKYVGFCGIVGPRTHVTVQSMIRDPVSRDFIPAFRLNAIRGLRVWTKRIGYAPSYATTSVYASEIYEILLMFYVQLNHRLRLYWKVRHGYLSSISVISTNTFGLQTLTPQDTHSPPLNGTCQLPPSNSPH